jgi:hypothetical protein
VRRDHGINRRSIDGYQVQSDDEFRDIGDAGFQQVTNPAATRQKIHRLFDLDICR